jgi:predicted alpha/beta superfamily hydrolase
MIAPQDWFHVPPVETHTIQSSHVDQDYQIYVARPLTREGSEERIPVLFLTDANSTFQLAAAISLGLQISGATARFILVGIGYPGDNPLAGALLRCRDLSPPHRTEPDGMIRSLPIRGVPEIPPGKKSWNGAPEFIQFLREELFPFIDQRYPTIPTDRAYAGHSMGAGFGLHVLFSGAALFNRYVLSSPGLTIDGDDHAIHEAKDFAAMKQVVDTRVFISVGELEEYGAAGERAQFVSSFYRLTALLKRADIDGLRLECRSFPDETHASVFPLAFSHGIRSVFPGPHTPLI